MVIAAPRKPRRRSRSPRYIGARFKREEITLSVTPIYGRSFKHLFDAQPDKFQGYAILLPESQMIIYPNSQAGLNMAEIKARSLGKEAQVVYIEEVPADLPFRN